MTQKLLNYDHAVAPQERSWDCGPASTQVVLNALGIVVSEDDLIREIGTTTNGTDDISWVENRCLDKRVAAANYTSVYLRNDPPTAQQIGALWSDVKRSIDAGYGVVMNWVSPPSNRPIGILGSKSPNYGWNTVYHYVPCMGYDDVARALWIADPGFNPFGYWVSLDNAASLIPPKGYCYANVGVAAPAPVVTDHNDPVPSFDQVAMAFIAEGRRRNVTPRGIVITLSVGLVEANLKIYANPKVPESMQIPHNAVGYDSYSVGPCQQQVVMGANGWWWGDARTCMDKTLSPGLFYDRLVRLPYNDPAHSPGWYAAEIQQPAAQYRGRYDERMGEAQQLYDRLSTVSIDPLEELLMQSAPSMSIYSNPGEPDVPLAVMIAAQDAHGPHEPYVEKQARAGDPDALLRVARTAAGQGRAPAGTTPAAINQATGVLAEIKGVSVAEIRAQLKGTSA